MCPWHQGTLLPVVQERVVRTCDSVTGRTKWRLAGRHVVSTQNARWAGGRVGLLAKVLRYCVDVVDRRLVSDILLLHSLACVRRGKVLAHPAEETRGQFSKRNFRTDFEELFCVYNALPRVLRFLSLALFLSLSCIYVEGRCISCDF